MLLFCCTFSRNDWQWSCILTHKISIRHNRTGITSTQHFLQMLQTPIEHRQHVQKAPPAEPAQLLRHGPSSAPALGESSPCTMVCDSSVGAVLCEHKKPHGKQHSLPNWCSKLWIGKLLATKVLLWSCSWNIKLAAVRNGCSESTAIRGTGDELVLGCCWKAVTSTKKIKKGKKKSMKQKHLRFHIRGKEGGRRGASWQSAQRSRCRALPTGWLAAESCLSTAPAWAGGVRAASERPGAWCSTTEHGQLLLPRGHRHELEK